MSVAQHRKAAALLGYGLLAEFIHLAALSSGLAACRSGRPIAMSVSPKSRWIVREALLTRLPPSL